MSLHQGGEFPLEEFLKRTKSVQVLHVKAPELDANDLGGQLCKGLAGNTTLRKFRVQKFDHVPRLTGIFRAALKHPALQHISMASYCDRETCDDLADAAQQSNVEILDFWVDDSH